MTHLSPDFDGPNPEIAAIVAGVWSELFDAPDLVVGPDDNFFMLGGSSLLALELVAVLNARFAIRLDLLVPAEASTLRELTIEVARRGGSLSVAGAGDIEEGEIEEGEIEEGEIEEGEIEEGEIEEGEIA